MKQFPRNLYNSQGVSLVFHLKQYALKHIYVLILCWRQKTPKCIFLIRRKKLFIVCHRNAFFLCLLAFFCHSEKQITVWAYLKTIQGLQSCYYFKTERQIEHNQLSKRDVVDLLYAKLPANYILMRWAYLNILKQNFLVRVCIPGTVVAAYIKLRHFVIMYETCDGCNWLSVDRHIPCNNKRL